MNEIEISKKNDIEILTLIHDYKKQGYEVWVQKRCSDKYLMQTTEFNIGGTLDLDNSQLYQHQQSTDFQNLEQSPNKQEEVSSKCSIRDQMHSRKRSAMPTTIQLQSRESMILYPPRRTQTDLLSLLTPKMRMKESPKLEEYFNSLQDALQLDQLGQIGEAITQLHNLVKEIEPQLGVLNSDILHIIYVEAILTLGLFQSRIGQYQESKICLEKCLRIFIIKDQLLLAKIYLKLSVISLTLLSYQKSIDYAQQAIQIFEIFNLTVEIAQAMAQIGLVYAHLSYHEVALTLVYSALNKLKQKVNKDALCKDALCMGMVYHTLGSVFMLHEEYQEAIQFFDIAYDIKIQHPQEIFSQILTLNQIGNCCYHIGEYMKALELYEIALSIINEKNTLTEAQILNNIGITKIALKQDSSKELEKAIEIYLIYYNSNHPSVKRSLRNQLLVIK